MRRKAIGLKRVYKSYIEHFFSAIKEDGTYKTEERKKYKECLSHKQCSLAHSTSQQLYQQVVLIVFGRTLLLSIAEIHEAVV